MSYREVLARLYGANARVQPVKLGLSNILRLDTALGKPSTGLLAADVPRLLPAATTGGGDPDATTTTTTTTTRTEFVHVAGTNGKGSVCWKTEAALRHAGLRTGLFVSPHVASLRERVRLDGRLVSEDWVGRAMPHVFATAERENIPATFFELVTAFALLTFAEHAVDVAVLEVGLGGRLDATNIIPSPAVTAVTSLSRDHTRVLGHDIAGIAREKAGIAKPGAPLVAFARPCPAFDDADNVRVVDTLKAECARAGARGPLFVDVPREVEASSDFNRANTLLAHRVASEFVAEWNKKKEAKAIAPSAVVPQPDTSPPCRFEFLPLRQGVAPLLDVAHNPDGLCTFFRRFRETVLPLHGAPPTSASSLLFPRTRTCAPASTWPCRSARP